MIENCEKEKRTPFEDARDSAFKKGAENKSHERF